MTGLLRIRYHVRIKYNTCYHYSIDTDGAEHIRPDASGVEDMKWISREELKTLPMFDDCRETADVYLTLR